MDGSGWKFVSVGRGKPLPLSLLMINAYNSMPMKANIKSLLAVMCLSLLAGCLAQRPAVDETKISPELRQAESLFQQGRYAEAIIAAIDLQRQEPLTPGLADLQGRIMARLAEQRRRDYALRDRPSQVRMAEDVARHRMVPETYLLRRQIAGEDEPMITEPSRMQESLDRPVTVHLSDVSLSEFIAQIGLAENVNIVADSGLSDRTFSIHAEDTPLSELLEYVERHLGVAFSVGRNIIWVTPSVSAAPGQPLETRMYRLRRGISGDETEAGDDNLDVIRAINRFVPQVPGADIMFNRKAHLLLVKNTLANLTMIENLIEALDVTPPQVLIEARFINAGVSDLRELGVDWILDSPITTSGKTVMRDGVPVSRDRTQIDATTPQPVIGFTPFETAGQGLNFTYSGILTDPAFRAVVHAMDKSGKTRTLSVPRVTTVNNREATIRIGKDVRYFEQYDVVEVLAGDPSEPYYVSRLLPTGSPQLEEVGIELVVTPSVGADMATITLKLNPEISSLVDWEYYETEARGTTGTTGTTGTVNDNDRPTEEELGRGMVKLPVFERSFIDTEVVVRSGETVVMGGLVKSSDQNVRESVPFISAIPLIGHFFRSERTQAVQENLIIFVTATLISDMGESLLPLHEVSDIVEPPEFVEPDDAAEDDVAPDMVEPDGENDDD